jgi:ferredoxin-type protein NapG
MSSIGHVIKRIISRILGRKSVDLPMRPPGAIEETLFRIRCTRCGKCVEVCRRKAIRPVGADGWKDFGHRTPQLSPSEKACDLCFECVDVCPTGALRKVAVAQVRIGTAVLVPEKCIETGKGICQRCVDACPLKGTAIRLDGGRPAVDPAACVGCGLCVEACASRPAGITVTGRSKR